MRVIKAALRQLKSSMKPPINMDDVTVADLLKYNFLLVRENLKTHLPSHKLDQLHQEIVDYLPAIEGTPAGELVADAELERPLDIILMDERGRLRNVWGLGERKAVGQVDTQKLTPVSIDKGTLIYFGGIGNRAIYPNIVETDSKVQNRLGSTANTLEKVILPAYEAMGLVRGDQPKKERLRQLGITATYVYPYHPHRANLEAFSEEDIHLKTLIWDYELMRLHQDPEGYFGREEQIFVENLILPRIAKYIELDADGKFVRDEATGRIKVQGGYDNEQLMRNCRLTLVGYSLGADIIHRIRNCMAAYLNDMYSPSLVRRALQQVVAITSCGATPFLGEAPNFTSIRCVDIHDLGTLTRNPNFETFPWWDLEAGTYRAVYSGQNEMVCWMRTPYSSEERVNEGYHDEKFCLGAEYFPEIARNAIVRSSMYPGILPKKSLDYVSTAPSTFHPSLNEANLSFLGTGRLISLRNMLVTAAVVITTVLAALLHDLMLLAV